MSARLLAVDTTSEFASIALLEDDRVVEELMLHSPDGFAHVLFDQLRALLERNAWNISGIDCFAALNGPGSFTGVRVGLTAVKGLAEANARPAVAVSNLQALASFGTAQLRAPFLDARRGEIFAGLYDAALNQAAPERVLRFPAWLDSLPGNVEFVTAQPEMFRAAFAGTRFSASPLVEAPRALAAAAGRIAMRLFQQGHAMDPAAIDANYVRRSDAELFWRDDKA